jgi:hypothetical protein
MPLTAVIYDHRAVAEMPVHANVRYEVIVVKGILQQSWLRLATGFVGYGAVKGEQRHRTSRRVQQGC